MTLSHLPNTALPSISVKDMNSTHHGTPPLSTTSIHISKNWVLPERLKPGRKPVLRSGSDTSGTTAAGSTVMRHQLARSLLGTAPEPEVAVSNIGFNDIKEDLNEEKPTGGDSTARRRKQNRDAQRAYRERKANRIHVLEDTVNNLKNDVEMWKLKFDSLFKEQQTTQDELKETLEENINLSRQINFLQNELSNKDYIISPLQTKIENNSLNEMIQNFTPMKAIPLLKRTASNKQCSGDGTSSCCKGKLKEQKLKQEQENKNKNKNELPDMSVWTPGSCDNCKKDPGNKAFCQSIFKNNKNPQSNLPQFVKKTDSKLNQTQVQLPASPVSLSNENSSNTTNTQNSTCCGNCPKSKKEYIPITDTYQRIRKHMTSQKDNNLCISKLQNETNKNSTLINVLQKIATNIEVNGREIEINSIEHALNNLQD